VGPIKVRVRDALRIGGLTRDEAAKFGALGTRYFDQHVKWGAVTLDQEGRARLRETIAVEPRPIERPLVRVSEEERAAAAAENERRERERADWRRRMDAARTPEERLQVIEESKVAALAQRALKQLDQVDPDAPGLDLFGIALDGG
jgi:hypothetical protein